MFLQFWHGIELHYLEEAATICRRFFCNGGALPRQKSPNIKNSP
jgi:hypothetical protein